MVIGSLFFLLVGGVLFLVLVLVGQVLLFFCLAQWCCYCFFIDGNYKCCFYKVNWIEYWVDFVGFVFLRA